MQSQSACGLLIISYYHHGRTHGSAQGSFPRITAAAHTRGKPNDWQVHVRSMLGTDVYVVTKEGVGRVMMTDGNLRQTSRTEERRIPVSIVRGGKPAESLKMTSQSSTTKSDHRSGNLTSIQ